MPKKMGFASMDKEKRKKIAQMGGKAAHSAGKAHTWTTEQAKEANKKSLANRRKSTPIIEPNETD